jgi:glycerol uptake facilitator-like aquaporin
MFKGFPWRKAPYYIVSQIAGAVCGALIVAGIYHQQLAEVTAGMRALGLEKAIFSAQGVRSPPLPPDRRSYDYMCLSLQRRLAHEVLIVVVVVLQPAGIFGLMPAAGQDLGWAFFVRISDIELNALR